jgi:hypothetical protein
MKRNQESAGPRSDGRLEAALDALRIVAGNDPDHARQANGRGFARSDVSRGHSLSEASATAIRGTAAASEALRLAVRYRRQVPTSVRFGLGLTDQPDLFE